jgi:small subunit ribosomal protein S11
MPKKKKKIQNIADARIYVQATFNNTIISITSEQGDLLSWSSAGHLGFKGTRKSTPYAAQMAAENALEKAKPYDIQNFSIYISGVGPGREAATRAFQGKKYNLVNIKDITPIPHNGCRPKKPRKV